MKSIPGEGIFLGTWPSSLLCGPYDPVEGTMIEAHSVAPEALFRNDAVRYTSAFKCAYTDKQDNGKSSFISANIYPAKCSENNFSGWTDMAMIFENTDSALTVREISQALVEGLPHELSAPRASNKLWTTAVKSGLYKLGRRPGILVCCHNSKESGEWLLDVTWMDTDTHEIVLAVESEWGKAGDIEDDFDKLMSIKTWRKLLLFSTEIHDSKGIVMGLERLMLRYPYHLEGEEYLALNVTPEKPLSYHFRVPRDGRLDAVRFIEILPALRWPWPVSPESL